MTCRVAAILQKHHDLAVAITQLDRGLALFRCFERVDQTRRSRFSQCFSMRFAVVVVGFLLHPLCGINRMKERREDGEMVAALVAEDAVSFDGSHSLMLLVGEIFNGGKPDSSGLARDPKAAS